MALTQPPLPGALNRLILLVLTGCIGLASAALAAPVPFRGGTGSHVVVDVLVNGDGPFAFLVDTGSSHTVVTTATAARVRAPRVAKAEVSTPAGTQWAAAVRLDRLAFGPVNLTGLLATELSSPLPGGDVVAGVLGLDALSSRPFTLDYERRELSWPEGAPPSRGLQSFDASEPVWRVRAGGAGGEATLVLDSAADAVVLFDRGQWRRLSYRGGTSALETVTGATSGRPAVLAVLNVGDAPLVQLPVVAVDGADIDRAHGDGLLPLHLFDRVTFWPREGLVQLSRGSTQRAFLLSLQ